MKPVASRAPSDRSESRETVPGDPEGSATLSVIVPVTERPRDLDWVYRTFAAELRESGRSFEFVFALEPWAESLADSLAPLMEAGEPIRILRTGQTVGESALLDAASATCTSDVFVTLPPYPRVQPGSLVTLVREIEEGEADLASAARQSEESSFVNRAQNRVFHGMLRYAGGQGFRDVASGVRAMKRTVMENVPLYGDFFRFLPILARREGFRVVEIEVPQHPEDRNSRIYPVGTYLRRLIDILGLMFLVRFTQKPLRFFGLLGSVSALAGGAILVVLLFQRLGGTGIADRPLLLLGALLLVLGIQAVAMGLIGEIIVHLNASQRRTYRVRRDPTDPAES